jgi:glutamate synthase (NADPH/NADH) large chain
MSGGIAYVLDLRRDRVNTEMVQVEELDSADREFVLDRIRRHHEETESAVAAALLDDPDAALARFSKVMPQDYKRVLQAQAQAELEGRDPIEAVMEAARA